MYIYASVSVIDIEPNMTKHLEDTSILALQECSYPTSKRGNISLMIFKCIKLPQIIPTKIQKKIIKSLSTDPQNISHKS